MQLERPRSRKIKSRQKRAQLDGTEEIVAISDKPVENQTPHDHIESHNNTSTLENVGYSNKMQSESEYDYEMLLASSETQALYPDVPAVSEPIKLGKERDSMAHLYSLLNPPTAPMGMEEEASITNPSGDEYALLSDLLLDNHYPNTLDTLHEETMLAFQNFSLNTSFDHELYRKLIQYSEFHSEALRIKSKLDPLQMVSKTLLDRAWKLNRTISKIEGKCPDNWKVVHTFFNEEAVFGVQTKNEIDINLSEIRHCVLKQYPVAIFNSKTAQIWIQDHIDNALLDIHELRERDLSHLFGCSDKRNDVVMKNICILIDILFSFEKLHYVTIEIFNFQDHERDSANFSSFENNLRTWISHLATCLLRIGNFFHHRHLLLHILRTPGIGTWGSSFVQWPIPYLYSSDFIDHYLVSFGAFLGPIDELDEQLKNHDLKKQMMKMSLKAFHDEGDWIVVPDVQFDFSSRDDSRLVLLEEDDYICIFRQFRLPEIVEFFFSYHISIYRNNVSCADFESSLILAFAFANRVFNFLERSCRILPTTFTRMLKVIMQAIVNLSQSVAHHFHPLAKLNTCVFFMQNEVLEKMTVHMELNRFIGNALTTIIRIRSNEAWKYAVRLPFNSIRTQARFRCLRDLLNGKLFNVRADQMQEYLLSAGANAKSFFPILLALILQEGEVKDEPFLDACRQLIRAAYEYSFCSSDLGPTLDESANECLRSICSYEPSLVSEIIAQARLTHPRPATIILLFKMLPVELWVPGLSDLRIISSMVQDPLISWKLKLARLLIDKICWERKVSALHNIDPSEYFGDPPNKPSLSCHES